MATKTKNQKANEPQETPVVPQGTESLELNDGSVPLKGETHTLPESANQSAPTPVETKVKEHKGGRKARTEQEKAEAERIRLAAEEAYRRVMEDAHKANPELGLIRPKGEKKAPEKTYQIKIGLVKARIPQAAYDRIQAWGGLAHLMAIGDGVEFDPNAVVETESDNSEEA